MYFLVSSYVLSLFIMGYNETIKAYDVSTDKINNRTTSNNII